MALQITGTGDFAGETLTFDGGHGELKFGEWEYPRVLTKFFGVVGASEIRGDLKTRRLHCDIWLHSSYANGAAVQDALDVLDDGIGFHGTLNETGSITRNFDEVTFLGFVPERGPLPPNGAVGFSGWFWIGRLLFEQLQPNEV